MNCSAFSMDLDPTAATSALSARLTEAQNFSAMPAHPKIPQRTAIAEAHSTQQANNFQTCLSLFEPKKTGKSLKRFQHNTPRNRNVAKMLLLKMNFRLGALCTGKAW